MGDLAVQAGLVAGHGICTVNLLPMADPDKRRTGFLGIEDLGLLLFYRLDRPVASQGFLNLLDVDFLSSFDRQ